MPVEGDWPAAEGEDAALLSCAKMAHGGSGTPPATVGVAVSGGSDSLAMLHLMTRAARHAGWALRAVTVDHRLRPEAAAEADRVGQVCASLCVPHDVLVWDHGEIAGNLMAAAGEARYGLMAEWAREKGVDLVCLAHTADDQAETFLMGLSRAAGLDGLTGMRQSFRVDGVAFRRPFLSRTRADLRAYLTRQGLSWIDDPSNENDRFTRVKARRAMKALKPLGITVDRLSGVIANLSSAQAVVHEAVARAGTEVITETAGSLHFQRRSFALCGPEVQRRLLIAVIRWIAGERHPPRETKLMALGMALAQGRDATLAGCGSAGRAKTCWVSREARACGGQVTVGQVWDGRWTVQGAEGVVRALGAAGLRFCPDWRATGLPRQVLEVSPGSWQGERLIAAPCAGFGVATATCAPSFHEFLLSH
ncbi:MAG: tRNA lysidine(34) synthetase TilS [Paracoccaceae bacterium]